MLKPVVSPRFLKTEQPKAQLSGDIAVGVLASRNFAWFWIASYTSRRCTVIALWGLDPEANFIADGSR